MSILSSTHTGCHAKIKEFLDSHHYIIGEIVSENPPVLKISCNIHYTFIKLNGNDIPCKITINKNGLTLSFYEWSMQDMNKIDVKDVKKCLDFIFRYCEFPEEWASTCIEYISKIFHSKIYLDADFFNDETTKEDRINRVEYGMRVGFNSFYLKNSDGQYTELKHADIDALKNK